MARLDVILAEGLQVVYIWEHDFREWQRKVASGAAPKITGYLRKHGTAGWRLEASAPQSFGHASKMTRKHSQSKQTTNSFPSTPPQFPRIGKFGRMQPQR
ncbi:unnamed protein product [Effrenium voratum]|nr:unnamed protein product [Effrenium voratum]